MHVRRDVGILLVAFAGDLSAADPLDAWSEIARLVEAAGGTQTRG